MKKKLVTISCAAFCLFLASPLSAVEVGENTFNKKFGVGLMVGEPTGASFKYWLDERSAIDGVLGISLDDTEDFSGHVDYLYHIHNVIPIDSGRFSVYFGGGPRFRARDHRDDLFGIRAVGGLDYMFENVPVDIFLEAGPVLDLTPDVEVRHTVGIGARFWF